jgi:8-oxo-dGTP pyrophosphatase MutT (NUDIX family)
MRDQPFEFSDDRIARFAAEIERTMMAEGRIHTGTDILKLVDADLSCSDRSLTVQPCRYGLQAGSCLALDYVHPLFDEFGGCLREYYLSRYPSRTLGDNPLAGCLGVSACVVVQQEGGERVLIVRRSARLASLASTYGSSVAGSVERGHSGDNLFELLQRTVSAEAEEELCLSPAEYRLVPLAYAREIFRGERPQLFAVLMTDLSAGGLSERLDSLGPATREFDDYIFLPSTGDPEREDRVPEQINYEAAMNLQLLREYLSRQQ